MDYYKKYLKYKKKYLNLQSLLSGSGGKGNREIRDQINLKKDLYGNPIESDDELGNSDSDDEQIRPIRNRPVPRQPTVSNFLDIPDSHFLQYSRDEGRFVRVGRPKLSLNQQHVFGKTSVREAINRINPNHYILCVQFDGRDLDMQIGLSETTKVGETFKTCAVRGVLEEVGLVVNPENMDFVTCVNWTNGDRSLLSQLYIAEVNQVFNDYHNASLIRNVRKDTHPDDKTRKSLVLLHGTKELLQLMLQRQIEGPGREGGINLMAIKKNKCLEICAYFYFSAVENDTDFDSLPGCNESKTELP